MDSIHYPKLFRMCSHTIFFIYYEKIPHLPLAFVLSKNSGLLFHSSLYFDPVCLIRHIQVRNNETRSLAVFTATIFQAFIL